MKNLLKKFKSILDENKKTYADNFKPLHKSLNIKPFLVLPYYKINMLRNIIVLPIK